MLKDLIKGSPRFSGAYPNSGTVSVRDVIWTDRGYAWETVARVAEHGLAIWDKNAGASRTSITTVAIGQAFWGWKEIAAAQAKNDWPRSLGVSAVFRSRASVIKLAALKADPAGKAREIRRVETAYRRAAVKLFTFPESRASFCGLTYSAVDGDDTQPAVWVWVSVGRGVFERVDQLAQEGPHAVRRVGNSVWGVRSTLGSLGDAGSVLEVGEDRVFFSLVLGHRDTHDVSIVTDVVPDSYVKYPPYVPPRSGVLRIGSALPLVGNVFDLHHPARLGRARVTSADRAGRIHGLTKAVRNSTHDVVGFHPGVSAIVKDINSVLFFDEAFTGLITPEGVAALLNWDHNRGLSILDRFRSEACGGLALPGHRDGLTFGRGLRAITLDDVFESRRLVLRNIYWNVARGSYVQAASLRSDHKAIFRIAGMPVAVPVPSHIIPLARRDYIKFLLRGIRKDPVPPGLVGVLPSFSLCPKSLPGDTHLAPLIDTRAILLRLQSLDAKALMRLLVCLKSSDFDSCVELYLGR